MAKVLVCDDEENLRKVIRKYAEFSNHEVDEACDGFEAVEKVRKNDYDIILMDVMMPEMDGFTAVKEIRKTKDIPIIMLTAKSQEYDKVLGFELGVDDYVVKPFSSKEIILRIDAILRRTATKDETVSENKQIYEKSGLFVDMDAYKVTIDSKESQMTLKEYDLLFFLIRNKNIALTRERLLNEVWGYDFFGDDRTLDTHIKMLRKSLKNYSNLIVTVRGLGYRFDG